MKSQFDPMAETYESFSEHPFRRYVEAPTIASIIGDIEGKKAIDFGCGSGVYARLLKAMGASEVVGYDVSQGMLNAAKLAETTTPVGINYVDTIGKNLFGKFDIVLGVYVLPYNKTKQELNDMFESMSALLKPEGRLIVLPISPDISTDTSYYENYGFRMVPQSPCSDGSVFHLELLEQAPITCYYWSRETLYECMIKSGFGQIEEHRFSSFDNRSASNVTDIWDKYISIPHALLMTAKRT